MSKSTAKTSTEKPGKPYPDFPLFAHATRRWCKKIRGKFHYFGPWNDPDGALQRYLGQKDDLYAGRAPPPGVDDLTLAHLCNRYLTAKKHQEQAGEIGIRTFDEYHIAAKMLIGAFGKDRLVDDLVAEDFEKYRANMAKGVGPVRLAKYVQITRSIFKYGYESRLMDKPMRYGPQFVKPSRRRMREVRHAKPLRMFEAKEIRRILDAASPQMKAMVLLGVNCGFGNTDVAQLPENAVDLAKRFVDFPRPKTAIPRRCPLWPETVQAIKDAMKKRPTSKDENGDVFVTKYGRRWVRATSNGKPINNVGHEFGKLLLTLGMKREGVSFYALRHTFETVGGETLDQAAVDRIMGHERDDMPTRYRQRIDDARLKNVVDHVRSWLFVKKVRCRKTR